MKRFMIVLAIVAILGLANSIQAATITVASENFESMSIMTNPTANGFTTSGGLAVGAGFTGIWVNRVAWRDLNGPAVCSLSKEIGTAVAGTTYTLEMDATVYDATATFSVNLDVGGTPFTTSQVQTLDTSNAWTTPLHIVLNYTATAADAGKTLTAVFAGDDSADPGRYIMDNLSVKSTAVPEPSMITILAAGLAGLLAYAWKKRK